MFQQLNEDQLGRRLSPHTDAVIRDYAPKEVGELKKAGVKSNLLKGVFPLRKSQQLPLLSPKLGSLSSPQGSKGANYITFTPKEKAINRNQFDYFSEKQPHSFRNQISVRTFGDHEKINTPSPIKVFDLGLTPNMGSEKKAFKFFKSSLTPHHPPPRLLNSKIANSVDQLGGKKSFLPSLSNSESKSTSFSQLSTNSVPSRSSINSKDRSQSRINALIRKSQINLPVNVTFFEMSTQSLLPFYRI